MLQTKWYANKTQASCTRLLRTKTTANDGAKSETNDDEYDNDNGG